MRKKKRKKETERVDSAKHAGGHDRQALLSPTTNPPLVPSRPGLSPRLELRSLRSDPPDPIRHFAITRPPLLMVSFQETLLDSMTDGLLLRDCSGETLIQRLR